MSITKHNLKRPDPATGRKVAYLVRVEGRRDPVSGKRRQYSKQVATMAEAKRLEAEWSAEIARGTALDPNKTTIAMLLDTWLAAKEGEEVSSETIHDYTIVIRKHLKPAFGDIQVQSLTAARVQAQYGLWRADGKSPRVIRGCHNVLPQALRHAVSHGIVASNVCASVKPPRLPNRKPTVWNREEVATFLTVASSDRLHPLWHLLVLEGMRRGEALGLRWRDVNFEHGTAHIVQTVTANKADRGRTVIQDRTKKASSRTVRLTNLTLQALREHQRTQDARRLAASAWHDHDLIICTAKGMPITPNNVSRSLEALLKRTGLPRIRVHDLRHTAVTMLLLAGVHAKVVQERLGHANIGITLGLYSHVLPDM